MSAKPISSSNNGDVEHVAGDGIGGDGVLRVHPLALLFPKDDKALADITESIRLRGQITPVVLLDGKVLDGVHRMAACVALGVPVQTVDYAGDDPLGFVIAANLDRRDLTPAQRAMIAARIANMKQGARTDLHPVGDPWDAGFLNATCNHGDSQVVSQGAAAARLRVSRKAVNEAGKILKHAAPAVVTEVEQGGRSLRSATATLAVGELVADPVESGAQAAAVAECARTARARMRERQKRLEDLLQELKRLTFAWEPDEVRLTAAVQHAVDTLVPWFLMLEERGEAWRRGR